jgi:hypothetical protein
MNLDPDPDQVFHDKKFLKNYSVKKWNILIVSRPWNTESNYTYNCIQWHTVLYFMPVFVPYDLETLNLILILFLFLR